jgi:hypothetical protein
MYWHSFLLIGLAVFLASCAATGQQVTDTISAKFGGQSIDQMVIAFGPPASSFQMTGGGASHQWQLGEQTNIRVSEHGYGSASTRYCKVRAVTDATGIVTSISTEDSSNLLGESLCAMRLGIFRQ